MRRLVSSPTCSSANAAHTELRSVSTSKKSRPDKKDRGAGKPAPFLFSEKRQGSLYCYQCAYGADDGTQAGFGLAVTAARRSSSGRQIEKCCSEEIILPGSGM